MTTVEKAKQKRAAQRAQFTKTYNKLRTVLQEETIDDYELDSTFELLSERFQQLSLSDEKVLTLLQDSDVSEEIFEKEYDEIEEYREKFILQKSAVTKRKQRSVPVAETSTAVPVLTSANVPTSQRVERRLPDFEIVKFDGDPHNWITFWNQFKRIHDDPSLEPDYKLQLLLHSTKPGSKPREIVSSFPISADNYQPAVTYLKERFGQESVLIQVYVRDLLQLIIVNKTSSIDLSTLYDKLQTQLRSLEALGVTHDNYAHFLYPLVESALPIDILKAWERERGKIKQSGKSDLDQLIEFLKNEVESEVRIKLARESFNDNTRVTTNNNQGKYKKNFDSNRKQHIPVAHELLTSNSKNFKGNFNDSYNLNKNKKNDCIFCEKSHASENCVEASSWSLAEKKNIVRQKNGCFVCLKTNSHFADRCFSKHKCIICKRRHFCIMCPELPVKEQNENLTVESEKTIATLTQGKQFSDVVLQTLIVKIHNGGKEMLIRAIYDSGSQRSYLSDDVIRVMNLKPVDTIMLQQSLFGGLETSEKLHEIYHVDLSNINGSYKCKIEVLNQAQICSKINRISSNAIAQECAALNIHFTDFSQQNRVNPEIKLLIGADVLPKLLTGKIISLSTGPFAIESKLGWSLIGCFDCEAQASVGSNNVSSSNIVNFNTAHYVVNLLTKGKCISELWRLDSLGITDPVFKSEEEMSEEIEQHFLSTIHLDKNGRYEVSLPFVMDKTRLPSNKPLAEKSAMNVKRKLIASDQIKEYGSVFSEWIDMDIIEKVESDDKVVRSHYLPHRPIFKNSETSPVRPVFNASSAASGNLSLNACLATGPNLISQIPSVLNKFRKFKIAVSGDIQKAFCMVGIQESDRDYLRFLWWEEGDLNKLVTYRHKRVVFGLTCSPYLLAATLQYHLNTVTGSLKETADVLRTSFYVDNCLVSLSSETEMVRFVTESQIIMSAGHFNLRSWQSNVPLSNLDSCGEAEISVLGLLWDTDNDTLACKIEPVSELKEPITKRVVLSKVHQVFDVIGYAAPVLLLPKLILQKTWELKLKWDEALPDDLSRQFKKWFSQLSLLANIRVPRWLGIQPTNILISCHLFCDASQLAYACCIFLRVEINEMVKVTLLSAKSKIRPLAKTTIPRMELLACSIGARLLSSTLKDLDLSGIRIYCWTDSSTALSWIKRNQNWGVFVQNRVKEIQSLTSTSSWNHIPGKNNPADLVSRGCTAEQLIEGRWWDGPNWLYFKEENWPKSNENPDEEIVCSEMRKTAIVNLSKFVNDSNWYYRYFSSYKKIVRMISWILRFYDRTRKIVTNCENDLSLSEFERGEKYLLKLIQQESFTGCSDPKLKKLNPILDNEGLLRAKTNLVFRDDKHNFKYPIILPSKHPVVKLLIMSVHKDLLHAGTSMLMSSLREQFWILKARKTIRDCLGKCVICQRFNKNHCEAQPGILPADRVSDAAIFEIVGVDLAGPLYIKGGQKAYIVLYTCAVYRAIHLELVTLLSTEAFLQSLRRFIARRGRPKIVYSDNGTNFVGANRVLNAIDWKRVSSQAVEHKIQWKFNPPSAAWWGGWWERLIQMVKRILRKVLGRASLTYEELLTVLCDCEQVLNNRPLTYVSEDVNVVAPLTPAMFLHEVKGSGVPDIDEVDNSKLNKRSKHLQGIREVLRSRFRSEYLGQLCQQSRIDKIKNPIVEGDVVLLEDPNKKRTFWCMARVLKLMTGKDGHKRLALIKTETTELLRPIQRLYRLELDNPINVNNEQMISADIVKTRSGRISKPPNRL